MHQLTVGQFKAKFSEVLDKVLKGKSIGITYGKSKFKMGLLKGKATYKLHDDFKMSDEELLKS